MAIPYGNSGALGANFNDIWAAGSGYTSYNDQPPFALGTQVTATDGSVWVYVKFGTGGVTGLGYTCVFDEDFLAVMWSNSTGAVGDKLGVPTAAALINNYGWLQVYGVCDSLRVAASCAANVQLASTTTAGEVDDAVATPTKMVAGPGALILTTARAASAGLAPATLNFPVVGVTN